MQPESLSVDLVAPGFELYVPPTPFSNPPAPEPGGRFVLLDDEHDVFYEVIYDSAPLHNTKHWAELALHTITDAAILFPPAQWARLVTNPDPGWLPTGFLVAIRSRETPEPDQQGPLFRAVKLGAVHVKPLSQQFMNWAALESLKGPELPAEMRAGLLRRVFDRRPGASLDNISYVNPRRVLDHMSRPWHRDGSWLNWELDHRFVGGRRIGEGQRWKVYAE